MRPEMKDTTSLQKQKDKSNKGPFLLRPPPVERNGINQKQKK